MEKTSRAGLLDAGLTLLARAGAAGLTVRAVEEEAGLAHGSVRHHFGDRHGLLAALFDHLADREQGTAQAGDVAGALQQWLGPGRALTLARYELFLLAVRDPTLRAPLLAGRERFIALAASRVGAEAAPAMVAALDGILLDALVRGTNDHTALSAAVGHLASSAVRPAR